MKVKSVGPADGVAWITGASSGIGKALMHTLIKDGWMVAATSRPGAKLDAAVAETDEKARAYGADLADAAALEDVVRRIEAEMGPIALAVLNAGIYLPVKAEAPDLEAFRKTFDVNLLGTAACLAAVNPRMCQRRRGQIAIVSSATGFGGMPTASAYGASKAALINMAECMAIELARWGVKVQAVTPGFVDTPAQDDNTFAKPMMVTPDQAAQKIAKGLRRNTFEITFPKGFTVPLQLTYTLPKNWYLSLVRNQTKWNTPLPEDAEPGGDYGP